MQVKIIAANSKNERDIKLSAPLKGRADVTTICATKPCKKNLRKGKKKNHIEKCPCVQGEKFAAENARACKGEKLRVEKCI